MTTITNDFTPGSQASKTLTLEDFAGDKLELIHYVESIDTDGFNVDLIVRECGDSCAFTLAREDAEALLGALASILLYNAPAKG